jgi:hypothetical protein
MREYKRKSFYLNNRTVFGMIWLFLIMCGGRGCGKTFSTQNYLLRRFFKHGEPCVWMRLKESSTRKLMANDGHDFIDPGLIEKWKLADKKIEVKGNSMYIDDKEFCRFLTISTFYQDKGIAGLNKTSKMKKPDDPTAKAAITKAVKKYKSIVIDEFQLEKSERVTVDVVYGLVNQLETICRHDTDRRIIMLGNTLEEAGDVLAECFKFIPDKPGIHRLTNKRAVIWSIEDSDEFKKAREHSIAGILAPEESTFTNTVHSDLDLITRKPIGKQTQIVRFSQTKYFTICGNVVTCQRVSDKSSLPTIVMRPYMPGYAYYKDRVKQIIEAAQQRQLMFDRLITLKLFMKEIQLIKGA